MFRLDPKADIDRTHYLGEILLAPRRLIDRFGSPQPCDGYKVSGSYKFKDIAGRVYTLYDWKATSLYSDGDSQDQWARLPTPEEFWANDSVHELMIGGREGTDIETFQAWLIHEVY
jgi:hypothetical protein